MQAFLRGMSKNVWNASAVKCEKNMEFSRVKPISNGILEGLANFCRISLGVKSL